METGIRKENLSIVYDVCNEIFKKYEDCFYTKEEVKKLKENEKNVFLK